jgi:hypothetical protein
MCFLDPSLFTRYLLLKRCVTNNILKNLIKIWLICYAPADFSKNNYLKNYKYLYIKVFKLVNLMKSDNYSKVDFI